MRTGEALRLPSTQASTPDRELGAVDSLGAQIGSKIELFREPAYDLLFSRHDILLNINAGASALYDDEARSGSWHVGEAPLISAMA